MVNSTKNFKSRQQSNQNFQSGQIVFKQLVIYLYFKKTNPQIWKLNLTGCHKNTYLICPNNLSKLQQTKVYMHKAENSDCKRCISIIN